MNISLEWVLGIIGAYISLNIFIWKIMFNRKESKLLKQMNENSERIKTHGEKISHLEGKTDSIEKSKLLKQINENSERIRTHGEKISRLERKTASIEENIGDIKIFMGETKLNFEHIKEYLDDIRRKIDVILNSINKIKDNRAFSREIDE